MMNRSGRALAVLALFALAACGGSDAADLRQEAGAPPLAGSARAVEGGEVGSPDEAATELSSANAPAAAAPASAPTGDDRPLSAAAPGPAGPPAPLPASGVPTGTDANDILVRAERTYAQIRSLEADFVQDVYVPLLDSTQRSRGRIFHRAPDRFRMQFSDPQGDLIVADGQYVWMYYPSNDPQQVLRGRLATGGQQFDLHREFLSDASQRYSATRTGSEAVGGRQAHALTLVPRGPSPYARVRIWVDAEDFLVRRFEIVEQNETARMLNLSNLRPNVSLADNLFRFTPPPGATVYDP
jgi:outer membrane lipoprotein carrier protein